MGNKGNVKSAGESRTFSEILVAALLILAAIAIVAGTICLLVFVVFPWGKLITVPGALIAVAVALVIFGVWKLVRGKK